MCIENLYFAVSSLILAIVFCIKRICKFVIIFFHNGFYWVYIIQNIFYSKACNIYNYYAIYSLISDILFCIKRNGIYPLLYYLLWSIIDLFLNLYISLKLSFIVQLNYWNIYLQIHRFMLHFLNYQPVHLSSILNKPFENGSSKQFFIESLHIMFCVIGIGRLPILWN